MIYTHPEPVTPVAAPVLDDAARYRKLKSLCWAVIRSFQDRARKGEDFDRMVDEYVPDQHRSC